MLDNGVTENTQTDVVGIKFPASWAYLYSSNVLHLYQPTIPDPPPNILVSGTTSSPSQVGTTTIDDTLGSLSGTALTHTPAACTTGF